MRYATCAVLSAVLALSCTNPLSAEEAQWWWPFGGDDQATQSSVAAPPSAPTQSVAPAEPESWFTRPTMPEWSWPEWTLGSDEAATAPTTPSRRTGVRVGVTQASAKRPKCSATAGPRPNNRPRRRRTTVRRGR
jgi:hypothetical protein